MKNDKIVRINGKRFDITASKPVNKAASANRLSNTASIHSMAQRTRTIYERTAQKPINQGVKLARKVGHSMDVARSKSISHFAPRTAPNSTKPTVKRTDIGPKKHPIALKADMARQKKADHISKTSVVKTTKAIKEEAIAEALNKPAEKPIKTSFFKRHTKSIVISAASIVVIVTAAILAYCNMPSFSVSIASAQAGIKATYPEYRPDGYSLNGPVSYSDGQVTINFHANTGDTKFSIKQQKSSWDSTAVKNMVNKYSNGEFLTTEERGLTIYTYDGNAAWVNGGILYTIDGDAKLSGDQIRRIATSL